MSAPIYSCVTGGAVALAAATAKSVLGVKAHANSGLLLKEASICFDGVTASAVPVLIELMYSTWATNGTMGTNNTSVTPVQVSGRVLTAGFTAGKTWTSEPTVITTIKELLVHPQAGIVYQIPLGDEPDCALGEGFVIRCTAPAIVNVRAQMSVVRC
jgi:hypothetical protein